MVMVDVVNIVASGHIGREIDLRQLNQDLDGFKTQYDPEVFHGLQIRCENLKPVLILYASGSYVIMGARTEDELHSLFRRFRTSLVKLGVVNGSDPDPPDIKNLICKGYLDDEVDLSSLVIKLGLERVEYEPEQSPFVYYWPEGFDCLITIPYNGEVIVTGVTDVDVARKVISHLRENIE